MHQRYGWTNVRQQKGIFSGCITTADDANILAGKLLAISVGRFNDAVSHELSFAGDAKLNGVTLYRLNPITGRKHQLRLHLSALGIPIVNDRLYPDSSSVDEDDFSKPLKLLARSVSFFDPLTGQERYFESGRKLSL